MVRDVSKMAEGEKLIKIRFKDQGEEITAEISDSVLSLFNSPSTSEEIKQGILQGIAEKHRELNKKKIPVPSLASSLSTCQAANVAAPFHASQNSSGMCSATSVPETETQETTTRRREPAPGDAAVKIFPIKFWKDSEEMALISLRTNMDYEFSSGSKGHPQLWGQILEALCAQGITVSLTQVTNKWNQLKKRYKEVKDHNNKTGNDRKTFKYMEEFDNLFGEKASTTPAFTIESVCSASSSDNGSLSSVNDTKVKKGKKRKSNTSQITILEEIIDISKTVNENAQKMHQEKLDRFDRFLDIFQDSVRGKKD